MLGWMSEVEVRDGAWKRVRDAMHCTRALKIVTHYFSPARRFRHPACRRRRWESDDVDHGSQSIHYHLISHFYLCDFDNVREPKNSHSHVAEPRSRCHPRSSLSSTISTWTFPDRRSSWKTSYQKSKMAASFAPSSPSPTTATSNLAATVSAAGPASRMGSTPSETAGSVGNPSPA